MISRSTARRRLRDDSLHQARRMFMQPGDDLYTGMIIAENPGRRLTWSSKHKPPCKEKNLTT